MRKKLFIVIILVTGVQALKAQFDAQMSNYWAAMSYYNPAYAGQTGNLEATLLSRVQWLGITNAPKTTIVTAQLPYQLFDKVHGFGATMFSDKAGLFSVTMFSGQYAWKKKMLKGNFSAGLQVGYISQSFDGTGVDIPEDEVHTKTDEAIPTTKVSGNSIDANLGVYFSKEKWYAGLSTAHLLAPELVLNDSYVYEIPRTYYFMAGYNIPLSNPLLELRPSLFLKTVEMSSLVLDEDSLIEKIETNTVKAMLHNSQIDATIRMVYDKRFSAGFSWRNGDAIVFSLGGKFKMIEAGYAYDFPISLVRRETTGSHEIFLRYSMDLNFKKGVKNKYKSVRIL
jgi:type IX secretion system PorP/SprF family membrane protein